ncbi:MAG: 50S ribosome-binding GTPase [Planctomycetia bacterium]|nr:50S ribosome-binding GTPase [Planctomycetia bacterium]
MEVRSPVATTDGREGKKARSVVAPEFLQREASATLAASASSIQELCRLITALESLGESLGVPDPRRTEWYGQLLDKLAPQVSGEALLVAAVCGGTNTGKSLITNALIGSQISCSVPGAARTRFPVASLPRGMADKINPSELFPEFVTVPWRSPQDGIDGYGDESLPAEAGSHLLIWREDPSGQQPTRLVLIDTPDIDGTLRENGHRARLVRNACDVIVAVLTQQKYNDAPVREFFTAAATAKKTVIVVFNMIDWPQQRQRIAGWLATFMAETGVKPAAVYAVPFSAEAAAAGRIVFHALPELNAHAKSSLVIEGDCPEGVADLAARLAGPDFDRIKLEAMKGALAVVLDPDQGAGAWLDAFESTAQQWQQARRVLGDRASVKVDLPSAPRELVWNEIWQWLEPKRSGFDLTVSKVYRVAGKGVMWVARQTGLTRSEAKSREDFSALELAALKQALTSFVERLQDTSRSNPRLATMLQGVLVEGDRTAWYADLERRHAALPIVSRDYRTFVRSELDHFSSNNPDTVRWIVTGLNVGAFARPAITVALGLAGAAAVPAAAATAGGLSTLVHHVGDVVVGTAATLAGEGALGLTVAGLKPLIETLFAGWSAERSRVLAETLHRVVLGDRLDEIDRLATAAARPEVAAARRLLFNIREFSR